MLAFFFEACYNMRVIKRNARCFRLVTPLSSSFSPLSYMDRAQNRKALCPIHFCRIRGKESGGLPVRKARRSFICHRSACRKGKVLPRRKGESTAAPQGESTAAPQGGAGRHCGAPGCFPNATAGRRAASRTPLRGAGLTSRTPLRRPLRRHWRLCSSSRRRSFWRSRG